MILQPPISTLFPYTTLFRSCILTKNVITSCSVTMMLFLHLEVKPLMTLTTVIRGRSEERFSRNAETDLVCRLLLEKKNKNNEERNVFHGDFLSLDNICFFDR